MAGGDNPNFQSDDFKILGLPDDGTLLNCKSKGIHVHPKPAQLTWNRQRLTAGRSYRFYRGLLPRQLKKGKGIGYWRRWRHRHNCFAIGAAAGCRCLYIRLGRKMHAQQLGAAAE